FGNSVVLWYDKGYGKDAGLAGGMEKPYVIQKFEAGFDSNADAIPLRSAANLEEFLYYENNGIKYGRISKQYTGGTHDIYLHYNGALTPQYMTADDLEGDRYHFDPATGRLTYVETLIAGTWQNKSEWEEIWFNAIDGGPARYYHKKQTPQGLEYWDITFNSTTGKPSEGKYYKGGTPKYTAYFNDYGQLDRVVNDETGAIFYYWTDDQGEPQLDYAEIEDLIVYFQDNEPVACDDYGNKVTFVMDPLAWNGIDSLPYAEYWPDNLAVDEDTADGTGQRDIIVWYTLEDDGNGGYINGMFTDPPTIAYVDVEQWANQLGPDEQGYGGTWQWFRYEYAADGTTIVGVETNGGVSYYYDGINNTPSYAVDLNNNELYLRTFTQIPGLDGITNPNINQMHLDLSDSSVYLFQANGALDKVYDLFNETTFTWNDNPDADAATEDGQWASGQHWDPYSYVNGDSTPNPDAAHYPEHPLHQPTANYDASITYLPDGSGRPDYIDSFNWVWTGSTWENKGGRYDFVYQPDNDPTYGWGWLDYIAYFDTTTSEGWYYNQYMSYADTDRTYDFGDDEFEGKAMWFYSGGLKEKMAERNSFTLRDGASGAQAKGWDWYYYEDRTCSILKQASPSPIYIYDQPISAVWPEKRWREKDGDPWQYYYDEYHYTYSDATKINSIDTSIEHHKTWDVSMPWVDEILYSSVARVFDENNYKNGTFEIRYDGKDRPIEVKTFNEAHEPVVVVNQEWDEVRVTRRIYEDKKADFTATWEWTTDPSKATTNTDFYLTEINVDGVISYNQEIDSLGHRSKVWSGSDWRDNMVLTYNDASTKYLDMKRQRIQQLEQLVDTMSGETYSFLGGYYRYESIDPVSGFLIKAVDETWELPYGWGMAPGPIPPNPQCDIQWLARWYYDDITPQASDDAIISRGRYDAVRPLNNSMDKFRIKAGYSTLADFAEDYGSDVASTTIMRPADEIGDYVLGPHWHSNGYDWYDWYPGDPPPPPGYWCGGATVLDITYAEVPGSGGEKTLYAIQAGTPLTKNDFINHDVTVDKYYVSGSYPTYAVDPAYGTTYDWAYEKWLDEATGLGYYDYNYHGTYGVQSVSVKSYSDLVGSNSWFSVDYWNTNDLEGQLPPGTDTWGFYNYSQVKGLLNNMSYEEFKRRFGYLYDAYQTDNEDDPAYGYQTFIAGSLVLLWNAMDSTTNVSGFNRNTLHA
ncbi:MAG: hypothetical protein Q8R48_02610, partial [Candidatus Omnitrophota bacterium]|nr:hypothetical protein [Candidatus Omnitrophota bacterium]